MNVMNRIQQLQCVDALVGAAIVCAGLAAHGLLPFTDYLLWDGWWYAADLVRGEGAPTMTRLFREVGRPMDMAFYMPMRLFGGDPIVWAKWLGMIAWIASGLCIAFVLRRGGGLAPPTATAIAVLSVTLPVFDLLGELALWMNTACVFLFWVSWALLVSLASAKSWLRYPIRLGAIVLFFVSFNLNSNLVMFYAVAAMLVGLRSADVPWPAIPLRVWRLAAAKADFLLLPILFWLWKTVFTPTSGYYAQGYNQPSLEPMQFVSGYSAMAVNFIGAGFLELVASASWVGLSAAVAIAVGFMLSKHAANRLNHNEIPTAQIAWWGVALLGAAAFAYLAVGQNLASEGWLSRNAILCNVPLAMIIVGGLGALNSKAASSLPWLWAAGVVMVAVLGIGNCHRNYFALQAFGAKEKSVQRKLQAAIAEHDACVVQLRDYYFLTGTIAYYPPAIWTFLASGTASTPKTFVVDTRAMAPDQISQSAQGRNEVIMPQLTPSASDIDQAITATTMPYTMEGIRRAGPQILFAVLPGSLGNESIQIGKRYVAMKLFDPKKAEQLEEQLTQARVVPLPAVRE
jgi:hypothetical protein